MSELADLLERFRRGAEVLAMATTGAAGPVLEFRVSEGSRSVRQMVCGLADGEIVAAMWLRQILAEENPKLQAFDEAAWATKLDYGKRKISQALENFRRLRVENHELLKDQPESAFERRATHSKDGPTTLRRVVEQYAANLEDQVREIQAVRAAYREHRAQQTAQAAAQPQT